MAENTTASGMARLALDWLAALEDGQRGNALHAFDDSLRGDWHYTPRRRPGLPLGAMTGDQRRRADALLDFALSEAGRRKADQVRALELVLRQLGGSSSHRDPENYALALFGNPGTDGPWAWRFEGHHLSLTFTVAADGGIAVTPSFWGANPARVPVPPHEGLRVLADEQDLAFSLIQDLDESRREAVMLRDRSLGNIVSGPGRADALKAPAGLPLSALSDGQRDLAMRIVETYAHNLRPDLAAETLRRVREAGVEGIHFAWAGSLSLGAAYYYRLHGPVLLIEHDNTQNDANHIHSVWRDPTRDFGGDLLAGHYRHGHTHRHA